MGRMSWLLNKTLALDLTANLCDTVAADNFMTEFQEYIEVRDLFPTVFSCDMTGLFWKKAPKRTPISQEKSLLGHRRWAG